MNPSGLEEKLSRRQLFKMFWSKPDMILIVDKEKCTGCGLCAVDCQTEALTLLQGVEDDAYQLLFQHDLCNNCGICEKSCPENCLSLEQMLEPKNRRGNTPTAVFEDRISRCRGCGIPLSPLAMVNHIKSKISATGEYGFPFEFCPSCRIKIQIGREIVGKSET
ncbi:MAG: 4Fe-4S binding protein [Anaerolineaceae bacterium]|nr:4Fe-4S binding protein [Anaerolineaceae bacterium]